MQFRFGTARDAMVLLVIVAGLSCFGIFTRPIGLLAVIWPANAVLLGLMVRQPRFNSVLCWAGAAAGYLLADLTTGGELWKTLLLTLGNMAGVAFGLIVFQALPETHRRLLAPVSALSLLLAVMAAGAGAGLVGLIAAPVLLQREAAWGFGYWFATELVNYIVVLPVVLSAPGLSDLRNQLRRLIDGGLRRTDLFPLLALALSIAVADVVGGPGSIAFPAPALLWCALRYNMFWSTILLAMTVNWQMYSAVWILDIGSGDDVISTTISVRLGLALLALSKLTVSTVNASLQDLIVAQRRAISLDHLTGAASRAAFLAQAGKQTAEWSRGALIMADIDHFKRINDAHGHALGDQALILFVQTVREQLRPGDCLGRLGGEEFAILLPGANEAEATTVAERIRRAVSSSALEIESGASVGFTVSQGVAQANGVASIDALLEQADRRLYAAKSAGRNRVCVDDRQVDPYAGHAMPAPAHRAG